MPVKVSMIAAMADNSAIGKDNALLWHIPDDMTWFREKTRGKPIIMGRKTFDSIGRALPKRLNIIVTRQDDYALPDFPEIKITQSLEEAIKVAKQQAVKDGVEEIFIIGGQQIYALGLPHSDTLYLTHVHDFYEADTFFPTVEWDDWQNIFAEKHDADGETPAFTFKIYDRK